MSPEEAQAQARGQRLTLDLVQAMIEQVTVDESVPEVAVISFHPLERPLRTNGGMVRP